VREKIRGKMKGEGGGMREKGSKCGRDKNYIHVFSLKHTQTYTHPTKHTNTDASAGNECGGSTRIQITYRIRMDKVNTYACICMYT